LDDNPLFQRTKVIESLPPLDHSQISYPPIQKNLWKEHAEVSSLSSEEVAEYRKRYEIKVEGEDVPRPAKAFHHFGFDDALMREIARQQFEVPTPIQKQAVPAALAGRDVLALAKTGSGKTLAFVWPMLVHIRHQGLAEGPNAVICAPTRELAHQIYIEAKKFAKVYAFKVIAVYGGKNKYLQVQELKQSCHIIVATPGRLIDIIKKKAISMQHVTYLVLDEADRMLDMGFEPQVRSIVGQIRPDRQTLFFSATFKRTVEKLTHDILTNPIKITIGNVGQANADVQQVVEVLASDADKWGWLLERMPVFTATGSVLIFVATKSASEQLAASLNAANFPAGVLHGDKAQVERTATMNSFKNGELNVLVATDVAARGLDVKHIRTVVNYDSARDINAHVHRIGRTGRAGSQDGVAYSLIARKEVQFAAHLVQNLEAAQQHVPPALMEMAMQNSWFRHKRGGSTHPPVSGSGSSSGSSSGSHQDRTGARDTDKNKPREAPSRSGIGFASGARRGHGSSAWGQASHVGVVRSQLQQAFRPASSDKESGSWRATKPHSQG
jgi:ATP-dependent RNA helicase DDX42